MKLDIVDVASLGAIPPISVTSYLRAQGWELTNVDRELGVFQKRIDGELVECDVPLREYRDYPRRIHEVLENLALLEQRSQLDVYQDLVRINQDVLRISIDVPETGRVGLDEAGELFSAARDLVLAAACSAHAKRPYFPGRKPARATDYVRHVNLAAPEAGSFVVVLESALPSTLLSAVGSDVPMDEPFERTALITLATAALSVQQAIEWSTARGSVERFSDDVDAGVNANYCDALASMLEQGPGRDVTLRFSWSPCRRLQREIPSQLRFAKHEAGVLRAASKYLKDRAPMSGFELVGQIVKLETSAPTQGGTVTVAGLVDEAVRQVQLYLSASDYQRALQAHQVEQIVSVEGELVKDGRSFRLHNARMFSVIS